MGYGGTYYEKNLFLSDGGEAEGYSDEFLEGTFHHEFSSILLNHYSSFLDNEAWKNINPGDFLYSDEDLGGAGAIRKGKSSVYFDKSLNKIGFINEYSMSTMENDFNEFARYLFLGNDDFYTIIRANKKLQEKYLLMVSFYNKIDNVFTENYFKNINEEDE